jgi:hypothetical protein
MPASKGPRCGRQLAARWPSVEALFCGKHEGHTPPCASVKALRKAAEHRNERRRELRKLGVMH